MTIYNINLGIGWASSGVEYAQAYRAGIFRSLNLSSQFIFTDMILADNIQHLTANIGFDDVEKRMVRFYVSSFLTKISL